MQYCKKLLEKEIFEREMNLIKYTHGYDSFSVKWSEEFRKEKIEELEMQIDSMREALSFLRTGNKIDGQGSVRCTHDGYTDDSLVQRRNVSDEPGGCEANHK